MRKLLVVGAIMALGVTWTGPANATEPTPNPTTSTVAGNPRCDGVKIEAENIQVGATYGPVTITAYDGKYVSFTSSEPIGLVIVKGGPNANLYDYNPAVTSDSNLHAPYNPNSGKYYGISHVNFCEVEKK
jgi:hypothetical protein